MEMGNHDAEKISAGIRKMAQRTRRSTPDSKALGRTTKHCLLRTTVTSYPTYTKSWIRYAKFTVPPGSLQTTPIEIVGSSSSLADLTPNTRGSTHQAKTMTNPASRAPENKRLSHKKSKQ